MLDAAEIVKVFFNEMRRFLLEKYSLKLPSPINSPELFSKDFINKSPKGKTIIMIKNIRINHVNISLIISSLVFSIYDTSFLKSR